MAIEQIVITSYSIHYTKLYEEVIRERLIHSKNPRPLIAGKTPEELQAFIIEMLEKRSEFYRRAKLNIDPVTEPAPLFAKRMGY